MAGVELAMTYPCFVLLEAGGAAECMLSGADRCLCLFTSLDRLAVYYRAKYGGDFDTREVGTLSFEDGADLARFLRRSEPGLAAQGVAHVALDALPGKASASVPIRELIGRLEPPS